tara:strand:- start:210 stop:434 length:225 start_codon:yes stop_codon:yes gene_type:complete
MSKIIHYRDKCIGCNSCVEIDPDKWEMCSEDGKSKLKKSKEKRGIYQLRIDEIEKEKAKKASESCPVGIIKVEA